MSRKRVLLDENLPHKLRTLLTECDVFTVAYMQWIGIRNGDLLAAAEDERFDVLVTSDQGFPHQQNIGGRNLAVLLVPAPDWNVVKDHVPRINEAIETCLPGTFAHVSFDRPTKT